MSGMLSRYSITGYWRRRDRQKRRVGECPGYTASVQIAAQLLLSIRSRFFIARVHVKGSMIYLKARKKGVRMKNENYQTMSLFELNKECLAGNKAALEEWERRWEEKFPEIKKLPDGRSGNKFNRHLNYTIGQGCQDAKKINRNRD
jgi:hypothetical protein